MFRFSRACSVDGASVIVSYYVGLVRRVTALGTLPRARPGTGKFV